MQGPRQRLLPQWMLRRGSCVRLFAAGMKPVAIPHECSCYPHQAPAQAQGEQISREICSLTNSPGHALHRLARGIKQAGHLPSGGEGGTAMRDIHVRGLWARQLRSHGSQSPSGPCASWRTQQPSIGCEGDDDGPDAHGRSAESPRWAWAGGCLGGKRRSGLRLR
jgi:hypothetical protein